MAQRAYDDAVWTPGQPMDPSTLTMPINEVSDRLLYVEKVLAGLQVGDLPMAGVMKTLEQTWLPDPATLFPGGSIGQEPMAFSWVYGQVGSAGTIQIAGSGRWTVVKNGAGDHTVTYPQYKNVPIALGVPFTTGATTAFRVHATTLTTTRFVLGADNDFNFWIVGR